MKLVCALALAAVSGGAFAQTPPPAQPPQHHAKQRSTLDFVRDVATMLAGKYDSETTLRQKADKLARLYSEKLRSIRHQIEWAQSLAASKVQDLGWQEKLNLAMELWRIRSSLDLLSLVTPDTFKEITGFDMPDFKALRDTYSHTESQLLKQLPGLH